MAPWADALYACDARWWRVYGREVERDFGGELWSADPAMTDYCHVMPTVDEPGLSLNPARTHDGWNSGHQTVNLVFHWGADPMVLLGFDFQRTLGQTHHHGKHDGDLPNLGTLDEWCRRMTLTAQDLRAQGVRVINASRATALTCFERLPLAAALAGEP